VGEVHIFYLWGNLKEISIKRPGVGERMILKRNFKEQNGG